MCLPQLSLLMVWGVPSFAEARQLQPGALGPARAKDFDTTPLAAAGLQWVQLALCWVQRSDRSVLRFCIKKTSKPTCPRGVCFLHHSLVPSAFSRLQREPPRRVPEGRGQPPGDSPAQLLGSGWGLAPKPKGEGSAGLPRHGYGPRWELSTVTAAPSLPPSHPTQSKGKFTGESKGSLISE